MESIIPLLLPSAKFGEPFILLLVSFAILGILDAIGWKRIEIKYVLFFTAIFVAIFIYNINFDISGFLASIPLLNSVEMFGSIAVLLLLREIGIGDRIFLSATFLVYPFWLIWSVIFLAFLLTRPVFKLASFFVKGEDMSMPFYPFLFLSTAIIYILVFTIWG